MPLKIILSLFFLLITAFNIAESDELYENYIAAINNKSTFQYFVVIKVKNLNTGLTREYCTKGDFLIGVIFREYNLDYKTDGFSKAYEIVINNKERYFELKNDSAIYNIGGINSYSMADLTHLEKRINFDALALKIRNSGEWRKEIRDDKTMRMYAHALFNRGILTGENNCWGGTLEYVNRKK